jgi:hypothetical protein
MLKKKIASAISHTYSARLSDCVASNAQDGADLNGTSAEINWHTIPTTLTERNDYMKKWMNPGGQ